MATGSNDAELDFNSVQRGNAEMERRCQEVIDACIAMGKTNPILSIHDIGAGGLSNGCPELVSDTGGRFELRKIQNEDTSMSPMEIWCCEAQERYVLAVRTQDLALFMALCARERCPAAAIGVATGDGRLTLEDTHFDNRPIDIPLDTILGRPPRMLRDVRSDRRPAPAIELAGVTIAEAVARVLRLPAVANKTYLITIADRSVTGLVARDQMVGPHQTPIADVAVTTTGFNAFTGEAMAMGERTNVALISGPASGRMAVGEALTNIAAADIGALGRVKLSANWMCACGEPGEDAALYETVRAVGMELCPRLGVSIPVGKDSLSMRTVWTTAAGTDQKITAPLSLVVSAFAPVLDVRRTVTPDFKRAGSALLLIDLGRGRRRLGGSALAQAFNQVGCEGPDLDEPDDLVAFFGAIQALVANGDLLAYHDRSDGGLFATLAEMAIGGRRGCRIELPAGVDPLAFLFAEELGAVIEVPAADGPRVIGVFEAAGLRDGVVRLGVTTPQPLLSLRRGPETLFEERVSALNAMWSELTCRMQALRDNPECAREEFEAARDEGDPGISPHVPFDLARPLPTLNGPRPRMAILREQGINGHVEMAAAFHAAGFECVDVHMTDLLAARVLLDDFAGLVACGGFSYGDVLGAGSGWAKSILFNDRLREMFQRFFERPDTFSLGVCNGCQMMSQLRSIVPGAAHWPAFARNRSEQFEARFVTVEVMPSPSVLLRGMEGARLPIAVAHGEGRADDSTGGSIATALDAGLVVMRYVDNCGAPAKRYPHNPNGSAGGLTAFTSRDGRATIMMPHPERGFRSVQMSYRPAGVFDGEEGPWAQMFRNARRFVP
jgi:phosphoribosylformylglycinamidine synthase